MLDGMRKKKEGFFYSFILLAVVAVMAFYGVDKASQDQNDGGVAAWVDGEAVSNREYRQMLEYKLSQYQQMFGAQYDEKLLYSLQVPQRTLDELVQFKLLGQQSKKLGVLVPDRELAEYIRSLPYYQKDGKFDAEQYNKLPNRGVEEKSMRERMQTSKFQNYLTDRVRFTPSAIQQDVTMQQTKVDVDYAKIDFNSLAPTSEPKDSEIQEFKKTGDSEIKQYFDAHRTEFTDKASVELRQIRVGVPFQAADNVKADARKKAEAIVKEVSKDNFETIAKNKSDDEHAKKGGLMGWIPRGTLEKPLEQALDKLKVGEISPLIETPYGFFVLKVENTKDARVGSLDEVKDKIVPKVLKEKSKKTWVEERRKKFEEMLASGKSIESELKSFKIELKKTGAFSIGQGYIPNIGSVDSMLDGISELSKENPIAKKLYYHQDSYYFVKLRSVEFPKTAELEKNRDSVEKKLSGDLQSELMKTWLEDLKKKANVQIEVSFGDKKGEAGGKGLIPETEQN